MRSTKAFVFICLAMMLTACAKTESISIQTKNGQEQVQEGSEWWEVTREGMENETTTTVSTVKTTASTAKVTEAETTGTEGEQQGGQQTVKVRPVSGKTSQEYYEEKEEPLDVYSPDLEIFGEPNTNNAIALCRVIINGVRFDMLDERVDSVVKHAGLTQDKECTFYNPFETDGSYDGIFWYGKGYGVYVNAEDESKRFSGSHVFIEGARGYGISTDVDLDMEGGFFLRSIYTSIGMTTDDNLVEFVGGIHCGSTREEVEFVFKSPGNVSKGYTYYANHDNVLLIRYNEEDIAEEIYLFSEGEHIRTQYTPVSDLSPAATDEIQPVRVEDAHFETLDGTGVQAPGRE